MKRKSLKTRAQAKFVVVSKKKIQTHIQHTHTWKKRNKKEEQMKQQQQQQQQ